MSALKRRTVAWLKLNQPRAGIYDGETSDMCDDVLSRVKCMEDCLEGLLFNHGADISLSARVAIIAALRWTGRVQP